MDIFDDVIKKTLHLEGGYTNHKDDRGGETYKGVARNFHPTWKGWKIIDNLKGHGFPKSLDSNEELQQLVKEFYKKEFWLSINADAVAELSPDVALELFDTGVNMGTTTAAKFLQETLNILNRNQKLYKNLPIDGKPGTITLNALSTLLRADGTDNYLITVMNLLQGCRYLTLIKHNESQEAFIRGWLKRIKIEKLYNNSV
jgi:lysozyme family protein